MATKRLYECPACGSRFPPSSVPSSARLPGVPGYHGRELELRRLGEAAAAARNGHPSVVFVHGDPGIGKSALLRAFYHQLAGPEIDPDDYWPDVLTDIAALRHTDADLVERRRQLSPPFLWLSGQAPAANNGLPLQPWLDALSGLEGLPKAGARSRAFAVARALAGGLADVGADAVGLGLVKTVIETGVEVRRAFAGQAGPARVSVLGTEARGAMATNIVSAVGALARDPEVPFTVLTLDDLHWADEATVSAVAAVARAATSGWKLVLVLGWRDSEVNTRECPFTAALASLRRYGSDSAYTITDLALGELGAEATLSLVRSYFARPSAELERWLAEEIGGTPLYLHQFCRMLVDKGLVGADGSVWVPEGVPGLRASVLSGALPTVLEAVLAERMLRLSEETRRLLAYGSVEGRQFSDMYLERVMASVHPPGTPVPRIRASLDEVERFHRLVHAAESGGTEGWSYSFGHELFRVAAAKLLSAPTRDACRSVLRNWLVSIWEHGQFTTRPLAQRRHLLGQLVAVLGEGGATEFLRPELVAEVFLAAAEVALRCGSPREAAAALDFGADAVRGRPGAASQGARLLRERAAIADEAGDIAGAERCLKEAIARCLALSSTGVDALVPVELSACEVAFGTILEARGDLAGAERLYASVLARDPGHRDACSQMVEVLLRRGAPAKAEPFARRALAASTNEAATVGGVLVAFARVSDALSVARVLLARGRIDAARRNVVDAERWVAGLPETGLSNDDLRAVMACRMNLSIAWRMIEDAMENAGQMEGAERGKVVDHQRSALDLARRRALDPDDLEALRDVADCAGNLAEDSLDDEEAERCWSEVERIRRELLRRVGDAASQRDLAQALEDIAGHAAGSDDDERAVVLLREAFALRRGLAEEVAGEGECLALVACRLSLGQALAGNEGLEHLRAALALVEPLNQNGDDQEAKALLADALAALGARTEEDDPTLAESLVRRAVALHEQMTAESEGADSLRALIDVMQSLLLMLGRSGRLDEAEEIAVRLVVVEDRILEATLEDEVCGASMSLGDYGELCESQELRELAGRLYRHGLAKLEASREEVDIWELPGRYRRLASWELHGGLAEHATKFADESVRASALIQDSDLRDAEMLGSLHLAADVYLRTGDVAAFRTFDTEARLLAEGLLTKGEASGVDDRAGELQRRGAWLLEERRLDEALSALREAEGIERTLLRREEGTEYADGWHQELAKTLLLVGRTLEASALPAEAVAAFSESEREWRRVGGADDEEVVAGLQAATLAVARLAPGTP